jgi:plastocyanin
MKKIYAGLVLITALFTSTTVMAQTKHTVTVQNFSFSPQNVNIQVGDTVKWQWVSGTHTTTSDITIGANSWDAPLSTSSRTYEHVITESGVHTYHCTPHQGMGMVGSITASLVGIDDGISQQPAKYKLNQNYPNPFNPTTTISFTVANQGRVKLSAYNTLGQEVAVLVDRDMSAGTYSVPFDGQKLSTGLYYYRLETKGFTSTRKMILLK